MSSIKHSAQPSQVTSNTLPLGNDGKKDLGKLLSMGFNHGLSIEQKEGKTFIATFVSLNISEKDIILYHFQTVKLFEVFDKLDEGGIKAISCDFMTIATKENNSELEKVECIHTRNMQYPVPDFKYLYPIASAAYKRFIDGTDKFPAFNN